MVDTEGKPLNERFQKTIGSVEVRCAYTDIVEASALKTHPENPNKHPREQVAILANLIEKHGWRQAITVSNLSGFVVRGAGRLEAARHKEWRHVPIDRQDYATTEDERADRLADNKANELSYYDEELERSILKDLQAADYDMSATGYIDDQIKAILEREGEDNHPFGGTSTEPTADGGASLWGSAAPSSDHHTVKIGDFMTLLSKPLLERLKTTTTLLFERDGQPVNVTFLKVIVKGLDAIDGENSDR